jgi:hypothetical protein
MQGLFSLFSFTSPVALVALAAVAIPVLIHLFNRSKGQRIVVGTLDFVRGAKSKRVTEIKLMHLLLLALRIAIVVLLALIMAGLMKDTTRKVSGPTVYTTASWLAAATPEDLDQVRAIADTIHMVRTDGILSFNLNKLNDVSNVERDDRDISGPLSAHLATTKHDGAIHVFAFATARQFADLAALSRYDIEWHLKPLQTGDEASPLRLSILIVKGPKFERQAADVAEAISRINTHRNADLQMSVVDAVSFDAAQAAQTDWIFWMNERDAAPLMAQSATSARLLHFRPDSAAGDGLQSLTLGTYPFTRFTASLNAEPTAGPYDAVWRSQSGDLLLSREAGVSGTDSYRLHFSLIGQPDSLARQPEFAVVLFTLLTSTDDLSTRYPDAALNQPASLQQAGAASAETGNISASRSMQALLAGLLLLLWAAERYLSERARYE